jgi:hypothetical protein
MEALGTLGALERPWPECAQPALRQPRAPAPPLLPRSFNMIEAARQASVRRFFYASSACIYPEYKQLDVEVEGGGLKEADAWPAQPQVGGVCKGGGLAPGSTGEVPAPQPPRAPPPMLL